MWFVLKRESFTKRRGDLFACYTLGGRRVPWYDGNERALLPLVAAERRRGEFERVALRLPPLWAACTGARWEFALRELYNDSGDVVGVEDTGHKSRKVARVHERPNQARKAVRDVIQCGRALRSVGVDERTYIVVDGMQVFPKSWEK